jgi:integrase
MARRLPSSSLETRGARLKLKPRAEPYWRGVERGTHLGYRRLETKDGTWLIRRYTGAGYRFTGIGTADDYSDADGVNCLTYNQATERARAKRGDNITPNQSASTTVREALASYEADLKARGGDTASVARVRLHLSDTLSAKAVGLLTADDLKHWRNTLRKKVSVGSVNRIANSFRAALNSVADSDSTINRHAWETGLKRMPGGDQARNVILPDDKIRRIVSESYGMSEAFGLLVEVLATTGARVNQVSRLEVGDVRNDRLTMPSSRKGKGEKISHTPIPIPPALALRLKQAARGRAAHELLLRKSSGEAWGKSQHNRGFARAVARAGLDPDEVTAYALRHSSIVRMIRAGVALRLVAVTHDTSTKMIESHYSKEIAHVADDDVRKAMLDLTETRDNVVKITPR